jgi:DNA-directed RNA polymerase subunit RPC12/RpoP
VTGADHPHYKRLLSREGSNWHYVKGLDIEGFPSMRVFIEFNTGKSVEDVVDGFGIYWYVCAKCKNKINDEDFIDKSTFLCQTCKEKLTKRIVRWNFGLREMMLAILQEANDKANIIGASTHRSQTDGNYNDPILQKKKTIQRNK